MRLIRHLTTDLMEQNYNTTLVLLCALPSSRSRRWSRELGRQVGAPRIRRNPSGIGTWWAFDAISGDPPRSPPSGAKVLGNPAFRFWTLNLVARPPHPACMACMQGTVHAPTSVPGESGRSRHPYPGSLATHTQHDGNNIRVVSSASAASGKLDQGKLAKANV